MEVIIIGKICSAIEKQKKLRFEYRGHERKVEPFCYGTSKKGKETLRAYQTEGGSVSGSVPDWKFFTVGKMSGLEVLDEKFRNNRSLYNPNDRDMKHIFCNV
ncbi:WYL domain-containing protein [Candidatus Nanohalococcus occultus]|uniref:WYL domain-containing protein n=1 Tax=Candidatus Nanohalococcus occultus TaxID=2978047 RepID=UPI0039E0A232